MQFLNKLERTVLGWFKGVPNLPTGARKWLGDNMWWIVLIGAILTGLGVLGSLAAISALLSVLDSVAVSYYTSTTVTSWAIVTGFVGLAFSIVEGVLLAVAVKPLKDKQKKGWVLLFATWLVGAIAVIVNSILSLNVFGFIIGILFGAVWAAISGYFLFEIHGQFAHVERSRGVKHAK
jgi:FtsH-binding integral membrane protein